MTLLDVAKLNKSFGLVKAADNINVAVAEREVVGMIGANGAGKTTFVNVITGYQKPDSGTITYQGRDITPLPPRHITRLGICRSFQVPQVFMTQTVEENLLIALGLAETARPPFWRKLRTPALLEQTEAALARYQLSAYRNQVAAVLPQGVRKLLDIAMAVAHKPRLILLDEPTSGVSLDEKFGIMDIVMGALKDEGVTAMFVEHDMDIIARYAKRVLAFYEGAILADGKPDDVLAHEDVQKHVIGRAAGKHVRHTASRATGNANPKHVPPRVASTKRPKAKTHSKRSIAKRGRRA